MGQLGIQMWTWTLCVFLSWMCGSQAVAGPQYMVAVPAVLEAGADTKFCASLRQPNETLVMTVTLMSKEKNTTLLIHSSSEEFRTCAEFKVPLVQNEEVQKFEVEVRGDTFYSKEVRKVMIRVYRPMTFVQTDKPIYLPGQTVHFRVVSLDTKLRPAGQLYDVIEIEDPNNNRIGQWLNKTSDGKILQLSYSLNPEAREGFYQVIVSMGEEKITYSFKVEKYVLPKFDVTVNIPEEVSIGHKEIDVEVCAKYTYGQPVPGTVKVQMCRPINHYTYRSFSINKWLQIITPCHMETKQADIKGCATLTFKMATFTKIDQKAVQDMLDVTVTMEEEGTGVSGLKIRRIRISYVIGKLSFTDTPKIYEQGSNVEGKIKAVYYNDTPIADMPVFMFEGNRWSPRLLLNLTTDSDGFATFSLSTDDFNGAVTIHVSNMLTLDQPAYRTAFYETGSHTLSASQPSSQDTKTVSTLQVKKKEALPCDTEQTISIQYTMVGEAQGSVDVMYLVLSRGAITMQGLKQVQVRDTSVNEGEVSFQLRVSPEMAPDVQVVAYAILPSENVIAHSADFTTEKCFSHQVGLEFSPSTVVPGEDTTMKLMAQPDSLCGVNIVDQSVLITESLKTLTTDKIFNLLPVTKVSDIPYEVQDPTECLPVRPRRDIRYPGQEKNDAHTVFKNVGLKMATNVFVRLPSCLKFKGREYHHSIYEYRLGYDNPVVKMETRVMQLTNTARSGIEKAGSPPPPIETVRTFFPETWLWDLVQVGASGTKDVSLTVPDTITTWETETFCLSPQGFGLAPRKEITVFQPFFLELTLPYSIIRGEQFELKATTFNYLTSCIMAVHVSMWKGSQVPEQIHIAKCHCDSSPLLRLHPHPLSGDQYTSCLCGNERKTLSWTMTPTALGVPNVTVTAEAVTSHASCDNEIVSVPDRGRIDVVTKPLIVKAEGTEMTKTYNWLLCPKGETLTEETEIQFPDNVIEGSARASVSVLGDILGRALKNLDGLLRMPYGCGEQNMALLAPNIYILQYLRGTEQLTPAIMEKAAGFLTSGYQRQLNYKHYNGPYSTFGEGTGAGNTWLTAFVLRTFAKAKSFIYIDPTNIEKSKTWLESKQRENGCFEQSGRLFNNRMKNPVVNKSLSCLKESIGNFSNTYTTALLAYVFTLAGDMETRAQLLQHLDTVAIRQGSFLHWSQTAKETSASLSVEISSYVMMAKLSASPTAEDLGYTAGIVRWLTGQQNSYGGFSSTQDTVVALQALSLYSTLVFSPTGSSTVKVQSPSGQLTFDVNQDNKLLYQETMLPAVTGKYGLEVTGTTCASVQISLLYNIPILADVTTVSVEVDTEVDSSSRKLKLNLKLKSLYSGKENSTNMVILDIKVLSGFVPDPESLKALKGAPQVDRVEQKEDHVLVYLRELPQGLVIPHRLVLVQELPVQNLKPAVVKIYDYYQPSDQAEAQYLYSAAD